MGIERKILDAYADGSAISFIIVSLDTSFNQVQKVLHMFKEQSRYKRTFTDDFKRMIAERDSNGVKRSDIAEELGINVNTVKKACELFGQALKQKESNEANLYTRIDGKFKMDKCPSCGSKKNNKVDDNITFCMKCNTEHEYYDGYVMKLNFEYLEE